MNQHDDKLKALLRQWSDIEPASNFEANVWRRIRQPVPVRAPALIDWLPVWLPQPAFALSAAIVVGLAIGISSGIFSAPATHAPEQLSFLAPHTLAGALRR